MSYSESPAEIHSETHEVDISGEPELPAESQNQKLYPSSDEYNQEKEQDDEPLYEFQMAAQSYERFKKFDTLMKIHASIGVVACIIMLLAWHWTGTNPKFWWWIYPFCFFSMTLTAHHYAIERKWAKLVVGLIIILNVTLFLTWALLLPFSPAVPWFIFPAYASVAGLVLANYFQQPASKRSKFRVLINEYWILNAFLFLVWLFFGQSFPWWIFPLFVLALPIILYRMKYTYKESRIWPYAAVISADINIVLFLTWIFTNTGFPWPFIPLGVCFGIVAILFYRERNKPSTPTATFDNTPITDSPPSKNDNPPSYLDNTEESV